MFSNMTASLIRHEQITTTLSKAKGLRPLIERVITLGKKGKLHDRRLAYAQVKDESVVSKLFDQIAKRYHDRNGGYTRILKAGFRFGDAAPMAVIELIDRNPEAKGAEDKERLIKVAAAAKENQSDL
jgi:large subunit ribosomal protein L17